MDKYKECEGCLTFIRTKNSTVFCKGGIIDARLTDCPCAKCLVKMTCVFMCEPWIKYRRTQQEEFKQIL